MHWFLLRWIEFQSTLPHGSACRRMSNYNMCENFNPRSLKGATWLSRRRQDWLQYFNPRSLAGATECQRQQYHAQFISIHAPSRERLCLAISIACSSNFNPRSLTGATKVVGGAVTLSEISIHAPSRERRGKTRIFIIILATFQSTLPHGSDSVAAAYTDIFGISIHAPSRERHIFPDIHALSADISIHAPSRERPKLLAVL